jgi:hypothetical protein
MENISTILGEVEVLEAAIACEYNAQDAEAARILAEIQGGIEASEVLRQYNAVISKRDEQEKRVAAVVGDIRVVQAGCSQNSLIVCIATE